MEPVKEVSKYIASKCANYDRDGMCLLYTSSAGSRLCPLFHNTGLKCKYAESSVLPGDERIEALYNAGNKGKQAADYCERCKKPFNRTSPRQIRCKSCAESVRKNKQRDYNATYRNKTDETGS